MGIGEKPLAVSAGTEGREMMNDLMAILIQMAVGLLALQVAALVWFGTRALVALGKLLETVAVSRQDAQETFSVMEARIARLETRCMMVNLGAGEKA